MVSPPRPTPYLPLEITTAIVNHLECCELDYDFNKSIWPIHTRDCIRNVQKARLISRDFLNGSAQLFGKLLSNTVFTLTPKCLQFLDHLSLNAELSSSIRTLTFGSTYISQLKPYRQRALQKKGSMNADLDAANQEIFKAWHSLNEIQTVDFNTGRAEEILSRIFRQFKGLRNLRFHPHVKMIRGNPYLGELTWPTKELRLMLAERTAKLGHVVLDRFRLAVYDDCYKIFPMIQRALSNSGVHLKSLISTPQRKSQRRKGLLAFYNPSPVPLSNIFGQMTLFYWTLPAAPQRLMNSTRRFTTMLSSILKNAPYLKSLHIIGTEYYTNIKCRYLSLPLKRPPRLDLLDLEGIDIDRDSLIALVSNNLRKLRLAYIPNISGEDWSHVLQDIKNSTALELLKLHCGKREICLTHGSVDCNCGVIPESVLKAISSERTVVVLCQGSGTWRGNEMVYRDGEAFEPRSHADVCYNDRWSDLGLPFTISRDGSYVAGTI